MKNASSFVKSLLIVILIVAIVVGGLIVYFNFIQPSKGQPNELPSGTPGVSSGDISSGDGSVSGDIDIPSGELPGDVSSGDAGSGDVDVPPVEDPEEQVLSVTIPFDTNFSGSSAYQIVVRGDNYYDAYNAGEEVSFLLIFDYEDEVLLPWDFLEVECPEYLSIERVEEQYNTFKVTFKGYTGGGFSVCLSGASLTENGSFIGESMDIGVLLLPSTGFDVIGGAV